MKAGLLRFEHHLQQLESQLLVAAQKKNPALWLYQNNARSPLFMLEGLCKLHAGLHNEKKFSKLKAHFKTLEDGLGQVDYYDATARELSARPNIPTSVISYLRAQSREKLQHLNEVLTEEGWIGDQPFRIIRIREKLSTADWKKEEKEALLIEDFYGEAIYNIHAFIQSTQYQFSNIETEVHELRRQLRWLSIYPQALMGSVQLAQMKVPAVVKKYCTPAVTGSPFNQLPAADEHRYFLLLNQPYFWAMSWMISELGNLKDEGLRVMAVKESLEGTSRLEEAEAMQKAYAILGKQQPQLEVLLKKAGLLCKKWFGEQHLEYLVAGVAGIKN